MFESKSMHNLIIQTLICLSQSMPLSPSIKVWCEQTGAAREEGGAVGVYDQPCWHYDLSNVMTLGILTRTNMEAMAEMKRQEWFLIPQTAVHVQGNVIRTRVLLVYTGTFILPRYSFNVLSHTRCGSCYKFRISYTYIPYEAVAAVRLNLHECKNEVPISKAVKTTVGVISK